MAACAAPGPPATAGQRRLSDADLVAYAASRFDASAMMEKQIVVGVHRGRRVVADFPCSDICPQYTIRIIHYDVAPGAPCAAAGGVTQTRRVPVSIAVMDKDFCIPGPLAAGRR
ncbi:MAG TPA: hypothetical protein VFE13_15645 [Caulobacteraceae bacterium]|nr:hypothetical protein [Caulobacteraceae bacterium]